MVGGTCTGAAVFSLYFQRRPPRLDRRPGCQRHLTRTDLTDCRGEASKSLPFETPKLMVTAQVSDNDFASLLDQRIKRLQEAKLIEHQPQQGETKPLKPRLSDRRYRRL
jgi:hypothetical protein